MANTVKVKQRVTAVIFDCDGVMFDSRRANEAYYNHILARFGKSPMNETQSDYAHMHTGADTVTHLFQDDPRLDEALAYRSRMSYMPFIPMMRMEPYLKALLRYLRPARKTAVATNRSDTMNQVLSAHGLEGYFDCVVSALDVERPKPHPDALVRVLDHFGLPPEETLYIGDSPIDESAAKAARVPLVAYKNRRLSADYYVEHFREIQDLLGDAGQ